MTNKLERLRELVRRADSSEHYWQQQASAMEFAAHGDWLLDRLEKLEAVYDVVTNLVESAITQADILENGDIVPTRCAVDPNIFDGLQDALAAAGEKE